MLVSRSAYYAWLKRPAKVISATTLNLYRRIKMLFKESRGSLGNSEMVKKLRKEGFVVGRYKVRSIMKSLGLKAELSPRNLQILKDRLQPNLMI